MQGPLLAGLYWEYAYNAGAKNTVCPGGEEARALGPCPLAPSDRNILYENRLLGLPRYYIIMFHSIVTYFDAILSRSFICTCIANFYIYFIFQNAST
jgi:hypothetical protein